YPRRAGHPDHPRGARHGPGHGSCRSGDGDGFRCTDRHRRPIGDPEQPGCHPGLSGGGAARLSTATETRPARPAGELPLGTTTIASRVRERAATMGDRVAMREKDFGVWQEVTWAAYWDPVLTVGPALLALGIEPGDR